MLRAPTTLAWSAWPQAVQTNSDWLRTGGIHNPAFGATTTASGASEPSVRRWGRLDFEIDCRAGLLRHEAVGRVTWTDRACRACRALLTMPALLWTEGLPAGCRRSAERILAPTPFPSRRPVCRAARACRYRQRCWHSLFRRQRRRACSRSIFLGFPPIYGSHHSICLFGWRDNQEPLRVQRRD